MQVYNVWQISGSLPQLVHIWEKYDVNLLIFVLVKLF